jgi:hypothetical protein
MQDTFFQIVRNISRITFPHIKKLQRIISLMLAFYVDLLWFGLYINEI